MGQTSQDRLRQYQQRKARTTHVTKAAWLAEHHDVADCTMQRRICRPPRHQCRKAGSPPQKKKVPCGTAIHNRA